MITRDDSNKGFGGSNGLGADGSGGSAIGLTSPKKHQPNNTFVYARRSVALR